jgi:hypothetical protein
MDDFARSPEVRRQPEPVSARVAALQECRSPRLGNRWRPFVKDPLAVSRESANPDDPRYPVVSGPAEW